MTHEIWKPPPEHIWQAVNRRKSWAKAAKAGMTIDSHPDGPPEWLHPGRLVVLATGWTAIRISHTFLHDDVWWVCARYHDSDPHSTMSVQCRPANCFRRLRGEDDNPFAKDPTYSEPEKNDMKDLYTWTDNGTEFFAHKLAVHPSGAWVMTLLDDKNSVVTKNKADMQLVLPYSVQMASNSDTKHFLAKTGDLAVGDVVLTDHNEIWRCTKIDTKERRATTWITGLKLTGTKLVSGED